MKNITVLAAALAAGMMTFAAEAKEFSKDTTVASLSAGKAIDSVKSGNRHRHHQVDKARTDARGNPSHREGWSS